VKRPRYLGQECSLDGCKNPKKSKDLCEKHYYRLRRYGTLERKLDDVSSENEKERFYRKFVPVPECGCWLWTAHLNSQGYGSFLLKNKTREYSHRFSWLLHKGNVPVGYDVCHKCDTRSCVNPDHLFLGTRKDNMQDCIRKGRFIYRDGRRSEKIYSWS
jgi:hypothetical protein